MKNYEVHKEVLRAILDGKFPKYLVHSTNLDLLIETKGTITLKVHRDVVWVEGPYGINYYAFCSITDARAYFLGQVKLPDFSRLSFYALNIWVERYDSYGLPYPEGLLENYEEAKNLEEQRALAAAMDRVFDLENGLQATPPTVPPVAE